MAAFNCNDNNLVAIRHGNSHVTYSLILSFERIKVIDENTLQPCNLLPAAQKAAINSVVFNSLTEGTVAKIKPGAFLTAAGYGFTNITLLDFTNNRIKHLEGGILEGLGELESVTFETNKIVSINPGAFRGARKLRYIRLGYNEIDRLHENTFAELPLLTFLSLPANDLDDSAPWWNLFSGLRELRTLDLSGNQLRNISSLNFHHTPLLTYLNLQNNALDSLFPSSIQSLPKTVEHMKLSNNPNLAYIAPGTFQALPPHLDWKQFEFKNPFGFSSCHYNTTRGGVECRCAADRFSPQWPHGGTYLGGESGVCVCPLGQILDHNGGYYACVQCPRNAYNGVEGGSECTPCPSDYITESMGSKSLQSCYEDPKHANYRRLETEGRTVITVVTVALILVVAGLAVAVRQYSWGYRVLMELTAMKEEELAKQVQEIAYLRDCGTGGFGQKRSHTKKN